MTDSDSDSSHDSRRPEEEEEHFQFENASNYAVRDIESENGESDEETMEAMVTKAIAAGRSRLDFFEMDDQGEELVFTDPLKYIRKHFILCFLSDFFRTLSN